MTAAYERKEYLIISARCSGASTALHLKRSFLTARITLLDRTQLSCPSAAAPDLNKIVRAEHADLLYLSLAVEALNIRKSDLIFKP